MSRATLLLTLMLMGVCAVAVPAQEPQAVQRRETGVSFDFQAADLRVVISALAEVAGLNVIYGELPNRTITLRTSQPVAIEEVREMLENVARANGLIAYQEGPLVRIEPATPVEEPIAAGAGPHVQRPAAVRRLFVHHLQHAQAEIVVRTLGTLFGLSTQFGPAGEGGGFQTLSQALDSQRQYTYRQLDPQAEFQAGVAQIEGTEEEAGTPMGLEQPVDMVPDLLTNSILVLATPADYAVIQDAIEEIDVRPLQALIEVVIAEVRRDRIRDLGVDIAVPPKEGGDPAVSFRLQGLSAGDVALGVLGIGDVDATVVIRALAADADVTILSRPIVLVQNNLEARILVGDQRPFVQVARVLPTDAAVQDQVVQYRNVGTQLVIRPTINEDGYVNLAVVQEVSTATNEFQFGAPVINTREAQTQLLVRDGNTAVLGGLIDHQDEESESGVPLLKDIPVLGGLFRSKQTRKIATEVVLLLTPHVLRSDEDMQDATREILQNSDYLTPAVPNPSLYFRGDTVVVPAPVDTVPLSSTAATSSEAVGR